MNLELKRKNEFKQAFKKRCFNFSLNLLKISENLRKKPSNFILIDQLVRAGTSIGANIVEGSNSVSKREFVNYFQIALKSASETLYWLSLLKEINMDSKKDLDLLIQECIEIKKIISTIILNTKNNSRL